MKLFILTNSRRFTYDSVRAAVVRAESETAARDIVANKAGDEGSITWLDPIYSICKELPLEGDAGLIISDFAAG